MHAFCHMDILHFICLPTEEHLGCFQFGLLMNKAAIHIGNRLLYGHIFFVYQGQYVGKRLLVVLHGKSMLNLIRNTHTVMALSLVQSRGSFPISFFSLFFS